MGIVVIDQHLIDDFSHVREADMKMILLAVNKFQNRFPHNNAVISFAYGESFKNLPKRDAARAFKGNGDPSIYIHEVNKEKVFTTMRGNKNDYCSIATFITKN